MSPKDKFSGVPTGGTREGGRPPNLALPLRPCVELGVPEGVPVPRSKL